MYTWLRAYFWGEQAYLTYWYAFLFSFVFTWRKVLVPSVAGGPFNEYMDISLYIGDILILSSLYLIIKHNYSIKSILDKLKLFHVEHTGVSILLIYLLVSLLWVGNSLLWIDSIISILRIITILSIFVFRFKYDKNPSNCSTWNNIKYFTFIFSIVVVLESIFGITQFILNHSLGIKLLGESILSQNIAGVAKIDFEQYKQIRGYGTFLHPNIFGGYLVLSIVFIYSFIHRWKGKLFHVEQLWLYFSILIGLLALLLTFSKGAIVSLVVVFGVYLFHVEQKRIKKMFHVEQWVFIGGIICLILTIFILGKEQILKSIQERFFLLEINRPLGEEIFIGKGLGQSVYDLSTNVYLEPWQLQPIHNLYLYIMNEIGLIGTGILIYIVYRYMKNVPRGTLMRYFPLLGTLGTLAMFDHYLWTIYVGQVMLALSLGWLVLLNHIEIDKT